MKKLLILLLAVLLLAGCTGPEIARAPEISMEEIPAYAGEPYVVIHDNVPGFTQEDLVTDSYESYSELDALNRCGVVMACIGQDLMPTQERGSIGQVKPTGWQTVKYDCVDGKYLYNRCHLIGFQLTGENANECNLITWRGCCPLRTWWQTT